MTDYFKSDFGYDEVECVWVCTITIDIQGYVGKGTNPLDAFELAWRAAREGHDFA